MNKRLIIIIILAVVAIAIAAALIALTVAITLTQIKGFTTKSLATQPKISTIKSTRVSSTTFPKTTPSKVSTTTFPKTTPSKVSTTTVPKTTPSKVSTTTFPKTTPSKVSTTTFPKTTPSKVSTTTFPKTTPSKVSTTTFPKTTPSKVSTTTFPKTTPSKVSTTTFPKTTPSKSSTTSFVTTEPSEVSTARSVSPKEPEVALFGNFTILHRTVSSMSDDAICNYLTAIVSAKQLNSTNCTILYKGSGNGKVNYKLVFMTATNANRQHVLMSASEAIAMNSSDISTFYINQSSITFGVEKGSVEAHCYKGNCSDSNVICISIIGDFRCVCLAGHTGDPNKGSCSNVCGTRTISGDRAAPSILHGQRAQRGAWPWQAFINIGVRNGSTFNASPQCGGILINDRWILTAAHCIEIKRNHPKIGKYVEKVEPDNVQILLGTISLNENPDMIVAYADKVHTHPMYNPSMHNNDVGLIRLSRPVSFSDTVRPICLPGKNPDLSRFKVCFDTGFGATLEDYISIDLLEAQMNMMPDSECRLYNPYYSNATQLCIGKPFLYGEANICFGDSGGPFACQDSNGVWSVIGVNSYVVGVPHYRCALSVVARVQAFDEWIKTTVSSN